MPQPSRRVAGLPKRTVLVAVAILSFIVGGCGDRLSEPSETSQPPSTNKPTPNRLSVGISSNNASGKPPAFAAPTFVEAQQQTGLDVRYSNGATGKWLMTESTGGGGGWIDFDRDGRCDLYLVQSGRAEESKNKRIPPNRLFRNRTGETFDDVTESARVGHTGYGQGIAVGDFNNDGFDDLYVTNAGHNVLYQNNGDGTFQEVTAAAGVDDRRWSTSAAWGDIDLDGDLDLFVCNYLKFDRNNPRLCKKLDGSPATCHPEQFSAEPNECFLNLGDGRFRPVATERDYGERTVSRWGS